MKIVLNRKYGGFGLSNSAKELLNIPTSEYVFDYDRTDKELISIIEKYGSDYVSDRLAKLEVFNIPDKATDWKINEYDGVEEVWYVLDGKIHIKPEWTI